MNRNEHCKKVFKHAFYHAHNNVLLNDSKSITTVRVLHNRAFFYDASKIDESSSNPFEFSHVISVVQTSSARSDGAKYMLSCSTKPEDKAKIESFVQLFLDEDRYIYYDLYEKMYYFFKRNLPDIFADYVLHVINEAWFEYSLSAEYDKLIHDMISSYNDDKHQIYPEELETCLGFILDNDNIPACIDKSFNECRSEIIHTIIESGVMDV